jgi:hypothetical protein
MSTMGGKQTFADVGERLLMADRKGCFSAIERERGRYALWHPGSITEKTDHIFYFSQPSWFGTQEAPDGKSTSCVQ